MTTALAAGLPEGYGWLGAVSSVVADWHDLGYESAWASEVAGPDFASALGAVAAASRRFGGFRLGVGVAPVQTRTAWLLATTAQSIAQLSGKPFALGLGASSPTIVNDWSGMPYEHPLLVVRETVKVARQVLGGRRTNFAGETIRSQGFRSQCPPDPGVSILLGALGPRSLAQAGAIADGVILNLLGPGHIKGVVAQVNRGTTQGQRPPSVVLLAYCLVTKDESAARVQVTRKMLPYVLVDRYAEFLASLGLGEDVARVRHAYAESGRDAALTQFSPTLLDALAVAGSPSSVASRLRAYLDAGVDTVVVCPLTPDLKVAHETYAAAALAG